MLQMKMNRRKSKKWRGCDMAKFSGEPQSQIVSWQYHGMLRNEANFVEAFLAMLTHELRKTEMMVMEGAMSRIGGILAAVRSVMCILDLDAAMKAGDPVQIARRLNLRTPDEMRGWADRMQGALQAQALLHGGIMNLAECWILVTTDAKTGRDQVVILDGDPNGPPDRTTRTTRTCFGVSMSLILAPARLP